MISEASLYQHIKRPEWGVSTIVATDEDRTTFLFEDGTRRVIMHGHMHLMERVLLPDAAMEDAQRKIAKYNRANGAGATAAKRTRTAKKSVAS